MGEPIDMNSLVPDNILGQALDEIRNRPDDLIQPSHSLRPYSLIHVEPELKSIYHTSRPNRVGST